MRFASVPFEWAVRDTLQGWRAIGVAITVAVPALFLLLVWALEGDLPADETEEVAAVFLTAFIIPPLATVLSLIVGGTVLRAPLEDGTIIYMLTRPIKRWQTGISRGLAVALIVALGTAVSGFLVTLLIGEIGMAFGALPGLFVGGFALGALYSLILSIHRFAIGAVIVHAVLEVSLARIPFPKLTRWTISWHSWGGMGRAADVAVAGGVLPNDGGSVLVPVVMGLLSLAVLGWLFERKAFNLGVAEA